MSHTRTIALVEDWTETVELVERYDGKTDTVVWMITVDTNVIAEYDEYDTAEEEFRAMTVGEMGYDENDGWADGYDGYETDLFYA